MDIILNIAFYVISVVFIIFAYEYARNSLKENIYKNYKHLIIFFIALVFFIFMFLFSNNQETGMYPGFDIDLFLQVFVPLATAFFIGLRQRNTPD